jgi:hypothetical protein
MRVFADFVMCTSRTKAQVTGHFESSYPYASPQPLTPNTVKVLPEPESP